MLSAPKVPADAAPYGDGEVLNSEEFARRLAETDDPLQVFRDALKRIDDGMGARFHAGASAAELVPARSRIMDTVVKQAWRRHVDGSRRDLCLVAVGGFGRGELHPGSDIDLMVLVCDERALERHRPGIESFLAFLWDVGLEVGQSVRTPADCELEGRNDVTVATNLMEARLLEGPQALFATMRERTGPHRIWPRDKFFEAKRAEQTHRHERFHDTAYKLEPNVKEGPGGLRDIQTIAWVAQRHFGGDTLHDLVEHEFLTEAEYQDLLRGQQFLWQVRFALHTLTKRREDRLLFDYQQQLAHQFGYRDEGHDLAIEQFMQRYYRTIMNLLRLNEMLLQLFEEAILLLHDTDRVERINRRFQKRKGFIEATSNDVFQRYPFALLEVFLLNAQHPATKGVRASTIRLIREHRHLIDAKFRKDVRARSLFMEILRQPHGITHELRRMNAYGVLGAYLPEFGQVVGRMQYDLFHTYTVDEHTLFLVRNLRRFYLPRFSHEFPHCSEVMQRIPKPELLYIAGLYHDIAKGRGGDHSELGARDAQRFCTQHGLSQFDTRLVVWLVRNHLLMSVTAQKQDVNDPEVVHEFASLVGDQLYLDHLYLLTVADIRATNPKLWNSWRAALLQELYFGTRRALRHGLGTAVDREQRIREIQSRAGALLTKRGIDKARITAVWEGFVADYFLRHTAEQVAWHTRAILKKADDGRALVLARKDNKGTEIFVYQREHDELFATTTAILDQLNLTVVDARIITARTGYTLDSYTVLEADGQPISDRSRTRQIAGRLRRALNDCESAQPHSSRRTPRQLRYFNTPTTVSFDDDESNRRTVVELITADRPGLLSRVGRVFTASGLRVHNARIATLGERAEDVFFVTDLHNQPIKDVREQERIRDMLVRELGDGQPRAH